MSYDLGTAHGKIDLEYEGAGEAAKADDDIDKIRDSSEKADASVSKFGKSLNNFLGFMGKASAAAGKGALAITSMVHAVQAVAGALAVMAPVAAAALAVIPGIVLAGAVAMGVFKAATAGVGDALKAAGGDADKFNEALKGLAPNAQSFAKSIRTAIGALKPMQQAMQNAFFNGTAGEVKKITAGMLGLQGQAVKTAVGFNEVFRRILEFASTPAAIGAIQSALKGVHNFLVNMDGAIKPLLTGFASLAGQAGQFGGALGDGLAGAMIKLGNAMANVNLKETFESAMVVLRPLGEILTNIGSIISSVFGGLGEGGAGALGVIGELTGKLAEFLNTAAGQEALTAFGAALSAISGAAGQVFLTLLTQLAPIIVALAPGVAELATQVAGVLVPALEIVGPLLAGIAGFLSDNMNWIGPLTIAITAAAAAYKIYTAATLAWVAAEKVAKAARLGAAASWVAAKLAIVASTAVTIANTVAQAANTAAGWLANTAAIVANTVALVAGKAIMLAVRAAVIAWTAVQWLLNIALTANPIGLIILAIAALIAIIILIATKTTWFQDIWRVVWEWIKNAAKAVADWFMGTLVPFFKQIFDGIAAIVQWAIDLVVSHFKFMQAMAKAIFDAVVAVIKWAIDFVVGYFKFLLSIVTTIWNAIMAAIKFAVDFIVGYFKFLLSIVTTIWNGILAAIQFAIQSIKNAIEGVKIIISRVTEFFGSVKTAIVSKLTEAVDFVRGIPGLIGNAIGNLGSLMYQKGVDLVQGFINGIKAMINKAKQTAKDLVSSVTNFLPGSPAKEGPLSGKGWTPHRGKSLVEGITEGMGAAVGKLQKMSAKIALVAAPVLPSAVGPAGLGQSTIPLRSLPVPAASAGDSITIQSLTLSLQGIWDMNDPQATRVLATRIVEAIESVKKEYR